MRLSTFFLFSLIFLQIIPAFSQQYDALKMRADSLYEAKNFKMAQKAYDAFLAYDSSSAEAFHRRGSCYMDAEMMELARRDFLLALNVDSLYANAYYNLGLIANQKEAFAEGLGYFRKYISLQPEDPEGLLNISINFVYLEEPDSFDRYFQRAYALDTTDERIYHLGAADYAFYEQFDKAEFFILKAIEKFPKEADFYELAIQIFEAQDKYAEALQVALKGKAAFPEELNWYHEAALHRILSHTPKEILQKDSSGQDKFSHISSEKTMKLSEWAKNKKSKYYYPSLLKKFKKTPLELGFDEYFMLYYGRGEQEDAQVFGSNLILKEVRETMSEGNYEEALSIIEKTWKEDVANLDLHYYAATCLAETGDMEGFEQAIQHYYGFALGIIYTGDGLSFEKAFIVNAVHDEYSIMDLLGLEVNEQALVHYEGHVYDVLTGQSGESSVEIYFNIDQHFGRLSQMIGGKKKKKRKN